MILTLGILDRVFRRKGKEFQLRQRTHEPEYGGRVAAAQALEQRAMLAGTVSGVVTLGDLILTGDGTGNGFDISDGTAVGEILVTPDGTTDVGGGVGVAVTFTGVTDDIKVSLPGGTNAVTTGVAAALGTVTPIDDLEINTGAGTDSVKVNNTTIGHNLKIGTGDGPDTVFVANSVPVMVGNDLEIKAGNGVNFVVLGGSSSPLAVQLAVADDLKIETGNDADDLILAQITVGSKTGITTGGGDDEVTIGNSSFMNKFSVKTGDGDDIVKVDGSFGGFNTFANIVVYDGGKHVVGDTLTNAAGNSYIAGQPLVKRFAP